MVASKLLGALTKCQDIRGALDSFMSWLSVHTFSCSTCRTLTMKLLEVFRLSVPLLHHCKQHGNIVYFSCRSGRSTCLDVARDVSSVPEPCCYSSPRLGKVAPVSTVSGFQLLPGPGPQAKEYGQKGFQGAGQPIMLSSPPGHMPPWSRLCNWEN